MARLAKIRLLLLLLPLAFPVLSSGEVDQRVRRFLPFNQEHNLRINHNKNASSHIKKVQKQNEEDYDTDLETPDDIITAGIANFVIPGIRGGINRLQNRFNSSSAINQIRKHGPLIGQLLDRFQETPIQELINAASAALESGPRIPTTTIRPRRRTRPTSHKPDTNQVTNQTTTIAPTPPTNAPVVWTNSYYPNGNGGNAQPLQISITVITKN